MNGDDQRRPVLGEAAWLELEDGRCAPVIVAGQHGPDALVRSVDHRFGLGGDLIRCPWADLTPRGGGRKP